MGYYITREIENKLLYASNWFPAVLITGPRQVGKTTMLKKMMSENRTYVTLDLEEDRKLAQSNPREFFKKYNLPICIDEVQKAPELFPYIKFIIDNYDVQPGTFWLSGSQKYDLMSLVSGGTHESLAGRVGLLDMSSLTQGELDSIIYHKPFKVVPEELIERGTFRRKLTTDELFERIWRGSLPEFYSHKTLLEEKLFFYKSYVNTYLNRDIGDSVSEQDKKSFKDLLKALCYRIGKDLNINSLSNELKVPKSKLSKWLGFLELSDILVLIEPYHNNGLQRVIKEPKVYFFDCGLISYFAHINSPMALKNSNLCGSILENYVVTEISKSYTNSLLECDLSYYRDINQNEVDLVLHYDDTLCPIEIKKGVHHRFSSIVDKFTILDKSTVRRGYGGVICLCDDLEQIDDRNFKIPVWLI